MASHGIEYPIWLAVWVSPTSCLWKLTLSQLNPGHYPHHILYHLCRAPGPHFTITSSDFKPSQVASSHNLHLHHRVHQGTAVVQDQLAIYAGASQKHLNLRQHWVNYSHCQHEGGEAAGCCWGLEVGPRSHLLQCHPMKLGFVRSQHGGQVQSAPQGERERALSSPSYVREDWSHLAAY